MLASAQASTRRRAHGRSLPRSGGSATPVQPTARRRRRHRHLPPPPRARRRHRTHGVQDMPETMPDPAVGTDARPGDRQDRCAPTRTQDVAERAPAEAAASAGPPPSRSMQERGDEKTLGTGTPAVSGAPGRLSGPGALQARESAAETRAPNPRANLTAGRDRPMRWRKALVRGQIYTPDTGLETFANDRFLPVTSLISACWCGLASVVHLTEARCVRETSAYCDCQTWVPYRYVVRNCSVERHRLPRSARGRQQRGADCS